MMKTYMYTSQLLVTLDKSANRIGTVNSSGCQT